jgi:GNAT superfamily N-acetyltransferase
MKYEPISTERFVIYSHEIQRPQKLGGMCRTVFQAWFHSQDIPRPICIVTINESMCDYVEWVHVEEEFRRQGIATEIIHAIEGVIPGITLEGATDEGEAWCDYYERKYASCPFGIAPQDGE